MTKFIYLKATIEKKMFVRFLQNLENIMKEISMWFIGKLHFFLRREAYFLARLYWYE